MANWFFNKDLEYPGAAPVSSGAAWVLYLPNQSTFAGGSGSTQNFYPVPPAYIQSGPGAVIGTPDCYTDIPNLQSIAGGSNYLIPPMSSLAWFTFGSGTIAQYQMQYGVTGNWQTLENIGAGLTNTNITRYIYSDGTNFRLVSSGGVTVVSLIVPT